jgi:hypothetical protein
LSGIKEPRDEAVLFWKMVKKEKQKVKPHDARLI